MSNPVLEAAHAEICKKVKQFQDGAGTFMSSDYKEASLRQDFLDPLFIALGWDVLHTTQIDPLQQEVKIEKSVIMAEGRKSADYAFSLSPAFSRPRFFCEAKKPSKKLPNPDDCFQAIRYGWNGNTPLAALTDFEDFYVMDCRAKPDLASATARILQKWHYTDWLDREKFAALYSLFGREAVANGSIERYVEHLKALPKSTGRQMRLVSVAAQPVDVDFLNQLEQWRGELAVAFRRGRPSLDAEALTETTQRALDRLVFVRFLEDKLIETDDRVSNWTSGDAWKQFRAAARELDSKYNGVLWKKHPILDDPTFEPSGSTWSDICFRISNRETPYLFNLIPIPVLGSIYERFLGNVIEIEVNKTEVVPKPEVRKAGGVYYTPEYIVDYITQNTLGPQLEGKTPAQVAKMHFADIACGSGSFLLGVYDYLLRWHGAYYTQHPREARRDGCIEINGTFRLSLKQRRAILENNLWGADIDAQAVEVSKLSLYLKLLEDETANSARQFQLDFGQRVLPDLDKNIVCGNSLIDWDINANGNLSAEEEQKINPMDWKATFPFLQKESGKFDAIVGNPPYVRIQTMQETMPAAPPYYSEHFKTAAKGNYDIYVMFVEKALELLGPKGGMGYILPHKFFNAQYGAATRKLIADGKHLSQVVHFGDNQIFTNATTYTCLLFCTKKSSKSFEFTRVTDVAEWQSGEQKSTSLNSDLVVSSDWIFSVSASGELMQKLNNYPDKLRDFAARIGQGIRTSANEIYVLDEKQRTANDRVSAISALGETVEMDGSVCSCFLQGRDIKRYSVVDSSKVVIMPYVLREGRAVLRSEADLQRVGVLDYLKAHQKTLAGRENGRMQGPNWYAFSRQQNIELMKQPKILVPDIADRAAFALDAKGEYALTSGYGITLKPDIQFSLLYLLGLLNSKLLSLFIRNVSTPMRGGFFRYFTQYIEQMPIRTIDFSNAADKKSHDAMVSLVEQMLTAQQERSLAQTEAETRRSLAKIASLDRRIDALVYELYGLTEEEIALVSD